MSKTTGSVHDTYNFDWNDLAFASKKPVSSLNATFIAAPRQLSQARLKQLVKTYLPQGNIIFGVAKEQYVKGLEENPAFRMLEQHDIQSLIDAVNAKSPQHKLYALHYLQRDMPFVLDKIPFKQVVLVRGSWYLSFHQQPSYYTLANKHVPFSYISPFTDEDEAKAYAASITKELQEAYSVSAGGLYTAKEMLTLANTAAKQSLDTTFQTGVTLGRTQGEQYKLIASAYNKVVPYQTYAMHFGNSRENNFSPPNDLNHYDAVHAEVELLIAAQKQGLDLSGTTVFINLLPCPGCSRMLSETDISEVVYTEDHSAGYAINMLEAAGKKVRRLV